MHKLLSQVAIKIDSRLSVKDPLTSAVGQEIIRQSVNLIESEGLEHFTFKKLATRLGSTETTIYRYFLNKQQIMMYLASWYWSVMEWKMVVATANVEAPKMLLDNALQVLSTPMEDLKETEYLNEAKLHNIVISESFKAFVVKHLAKKDRIGYFLAYAQLCESLASIIALNNKNYKTPKALAAALLEVSQHQMFLSKHLPELTDMNSDSASVHQLLHQLAFKALQEK